MKVNKIDLSNIMLKWEIQKMMSAYIKAEQNIVKQYEITDETIEFVTDNFGNMRALTEKEVLKNKMDAIEQQGIELLQEEKYELFTELKEIYEKYKQEYDRL